jgi:energy-coupling factor transport system permease protein
MTMRLYREGQTFLHRRHPLVKMAALSVLALAPTLFLNPVIPATFGLIAVGMGWLLGGVPPALLLRRLAWLAPAAVGITWVNWLFYGGPRLHPLVEWGPITLWAEGLWVGASIGLRIVCLASYSLLFVMTTDPTRLTVSLVQQARLPYRLAYTAMAAYRFLPGLLRDLDTVRMADRIRRASASRRWLDWPPAAFRISVPVLVNGIRRAERLAVAMDARGFGAFPGRTYLIRTPLQPSDGLFLLAVVVAAAGLVVALDQLGWASGWLAGAAESLVQGVTP